MSRSSGAESWTGRPVGVVGLGVAGTAVAEALADAGAAVVAWDRSRGDAVTANADGLAARGVRVELGNEPDVAGLDVVILSPGVPLDAPVVRAAQHAGIPLWSELELAWRLRGSRPASWLFVSGTNGKTTTTLMLESMLRAGGLRTAAVGNIGNSIVSAVVGPKRRDVLAVEVSASQLSFTSSPEPLASVCLNLAPDHLDHFGSMSAYRRDKTRVFDRSQVAAIHNADDPETGEMLREAKSGPLCRSVAFTLSVPRSQMLGVSDGVLIDRAFGGGDVASVADVRPSAPHNVANALAAAGLALAAGVRPEAVRAGLLEYRPAAHRIAAVGRIAGVAYVDDSKATNCHAALTSLLAYPSVVWVAGGLAKGQEFDDLVRRAGPRLRGAVLLGHDRKLIHDALSRHAPEVPVIDVSATDTGAMSHAVQAAMSLARSGDTVLLAPGCASWDMYSDYGERGDAFAAAFACMEGARECGRVAGAEEPADGEG